MPHADALAPVRDLVTVAHHSLLTVESRAPLSWIDLTPAVDRMVRACGLWIGTISVQTRHTTTGILVNEHEPLLFEDLTAMFERLAPAAFGYAHDDLRRRTVNLQPGERRNGHAHCRAALLRASETLNVSGGVVMRGRWQRVLFVDADGPQRREVSLLLAGVAERAAPVVRRPAIGSVG